MTGARPASTAATALDFTITDTNDPVGQLKERQLALLDTLVFLHGLGVEPATLQPAALAYSGCAREFDVLGHALVAPPPDVLKRLEQTLEKTEVAFLAVEQNVPMELFKKHFDEFKIGKNAVARYARLLSSRPFATDERRDRFEFLATRALRVLGSDGRYRFLADEQMAQALGYISRSSMASGEHTASNSAVDYLVDATMRVDQFTSVDEIFKSGWYINLYGYKTTLANKICEPDILRAVVALNIALSNRIQELSASAAAVRETSARLAATEIEAKKVLTEALAGDEEAVVSQRFHQERRRVRRDVGVRLEEIFGSVRQAQVAWRLTGGALALILVGGALYGYLRSPANQAPLSDAELSRLSPLLESGSYVYDEEKRPQLLGRLRQRSWQGASQTQRIKGFESLREELASRKVTSAVLEVNGRPVARIVNNGEIILAE